MSEHNEKQGNSCITEEAFDQFQSSATPVVEDSDDFITLDDIVPPQPSIPDLDELSEIPYDNEVILSSTASNADINHTNNTMQDNLELQLLDISGPHNNDKYLDEGIPREVEIMNTNTETDRVVVEYNPHDGLDFNGYQIGGQDFVVENNVIQDSLLSTTTIGKKPEPQASLGVNESNRRQSNRAKIPSRLKYPEISNTENNKNTTSKRRGRPKKDSIERIEPDSTNENSVVHENIEKKSNNSVSKKGRPRKTQEKCDTSTQDTSKLQDNKISSKQKRGRKLKKSTADLDKNEELSNAIKSIADEHLNETNSAEILSETSINAEKIENLTQPDNIMDVEDDGDDGDDVSLSQLKLNISASTTHKGKEETNTSEKNVIENEVTNEESDKNSTKRPSKMPIMDDFEYNVDKVVKESKKEEEVQPEINTSVENANDSLLVEDTSKRHRRGTKKTFKYDEDSEEEDPFANMPSSSEDDKPKKKKKGRRYNSDDEYVPLESKGSKIQTSDSEIDDDSEILGERKKRKRVHKKSETSSPRKKGRKSDIVKGKTQDAITGECPEMTLHDDDGEIIFEEVSVKSDDAYKTMRPADAWASSNEFENFIAQKIQGTNTKIKKITSKEKTDSAVTPIAIPTIDPKDAKKTVETSAQTNIVKTKSIEVQTSSPYDIPMKKTVQLTTSQSEKACEFLNSVVRTTSELGELMTEKSRAFMTKKINTENVTDTMKMDYCVKKSFLLFKLAKHNLMQMEEDLAKQYNEFLKENKLSHCREDQLEVMPKPIVEDDSDCEIVAEMPASKTNKGKPAEKSKKDKSFNPKTVFLNKELSIKIAKKPEVAKETKSKSKINVHSVWINDSLTVKKVKPSQSFLAQDSRNKKPPDTAYVTEKMVSDFFKQYYRQKAIAVCAPFVSTEWSHSRPEYVCNYFVKCEQLDVSAVPSSSNMESVKNESVVISLKPYNPNSLFTLCTKVIHQCLDLNNNNRKEFHPDKIIFSDKNAKKGPMTLFRLCIKTINCPLYSPPKQDDCSHEPLIEVNLDTTNNLTDSNAIKEPLSLLRLCVKQITCILTISPKKEKKQNIDFVYEPQIDVFTITQTAESLKSLCHRRIVDLLTEGSPKQTNKMMDNYLQDELCEQDHSHQSLTQISVGETRVKSLLTLCVRAIQAIQEPNDPFGICVSSLWETYLKQQEPESLKIIAYQNVKQLLHPEVLINAETANLEEENYNELDNFTINCVNTLTDEAFQNLEEPEFQEDTNFFSDEEHSNDYDVDNNVQDNEWVSQLQVQELRTCTTSNIEATEKNLNLEPNTVLEQHYDVGSEATSSNQVLSRIKEEPLDDYAENIVNPAIVKTEALPGLNEMTIIPESIVTKSELIDKSPNDAETGSAYDVETFENFVRSNKMMISTLNELNNEIFSQSALRVRRQHEPDFEDDNDINSLLVPQTYAPIYLEQAKGSLMNSSSDSESSNSKKGTGKKKIDKKKKDNKKTKKDNKTAKTKDVPLSKEKAPVVSTEVAVLTRRMRERIRQEEKTVESSDSENETMKLSLMSRKEEKKSKTKQTNDEIQCSNVDSTEKNDNDKFVGFDGTEQNENYYSNLRSEYEKLTAMNDETERATSPVLNLDQPIELLECEPTLPINNQIPDEVPQKSKKQDRERKVSKDKEKPPEQLKPQFSEKSGWHCYPIKTNEKKLYKNVKILLEKLPETFVETYLQYQEITDKDREDQEVDRLINLQTLNRTAKERDSKTRRLRNKNSNNDLNERSTSRSPSPVGSDHYAELTPSEDEANARDETPPPLPLLSTEDILAKNSLMDDQETDTDNETPKIKQENDTTRKRKKHSKSKAKTEDAVTDKDSLMDDQQTNTDYGTLKIKQENYATQKSKEHTKLKSTNNEPITDKGSVMDDQETDTDNETIKIKQENDTTQKSKKHSKSKAISDEPVNDKDLMLTADKMMNKELTLLHAPVVIEDDVGKVKEETRPTREGTRKSRSSNAKEKDHTKNEDDSSSEEEKQWVNTKEKLLKRMGKKEYTTADDAKRAKLVTEFIEKRNDEGRKTNRNISRKSRKKFLERRRQLGWLKKELLGEGSAGTSRGASGGLFKGRKNIRKVIDKKSLSRGTVLANMEEFERKRRLTLRQNKLRDLLGCDEGVNVLVINGEVCLEYDFEEHQPVVTVHQFFTSVMKAHQYEGVKFMWDACFESLGKIEEGHPGGGCILAHCMGLGKTLQVLALLHTVLTHPRVGMNRVLVCCPLSTVLNWVDEINKWLGPVTDKIKVFELSKLKKTYERAYQLEDWYNGGGIFIIGYELFRSLTTIDPEIDNIRPTIANKIRKALLDPGPDIIVCDEGHLLKNDYSVLAVAMSRVTTQRRIVLTGTPMQNNLREYYCMVNFIKPDLLGTYSEYSNRFENPIMNGQHRDSLEEDIKLMKARTHILHKVLEGCLQRQEASVLYPYLPKKHEYTLFIPLTKCQWDLYKHYINMYTNKNKPSVLKDFHILHKIWSHPQVLHNFHSKSQDALSKIKAEKLEDDLALEDRDMKPPVTEAWWLQYLDGGAMLDSLESSNKFVAVFRILHECIELGDKVLIFSTSLNCLDALEYFLKRINNWSLGHEYYRLDGSVPAEVRQKWVREFNAENNHKTKLFLISTRAGCLGLNMTAANRVIIMDTSWNPAHDIQSIFRVYRFGQKKDCYIYRLVAMGTMEQKIYERAVTKQAVACRVIDEQQIDRHYNMAELTEIYRYDESGSSVAGGVAVGVQDVVLLRVARDAALHAVHEHDSLLRGSEPALPEHERAAAWDQFQQEHATTQMQNDLAQSRVMTVEHPVAAPPPPDAAAAPPPEQPDPRGRKPKGEVVVKCRIPIQLPEQAAAPAAAAAAAAGELDTERQEKLVAQITNILIQHDFTRFMHEPRHIRDLVDKVRHMVTTGRPMPLGDDDLGARIAAALLNHERAPAVVPAPAPAPAPTPAPEAAPPPPEPPGPLLRSRGRPKKTKPVPAAPAPPPPAQPPPPAESLPKPTGRSRRKAALVARKHFENDSVIDLDDDDDDLYVADDDDDFCIADEEAPPAPPTPAPPPRTHPVTVYSGNRPKPGPRSKTKVAEKPPSPAPMEMSIELSDDEAEVVRPPPAANPKAAPKVKPEPHAAPPPREKEEGEAVPLHPSLLANKNFVKIVAHTYLAGNPMLDEDAAVLAAQYSILKTLKESESTGKEILGGPVYDIAKKVLGKDVMKKVHKANPQSKDLTADLSITSTLHKVLGMTVKTESAPGAAPAPAPVPPPPAPITPIKKPKIGPKSKVQLEEKVTPVTKCTFKISQGGLQTSSNASDECILPDAESPTLPNNNIVQINTPNPRPNLTEKQTQQDTSMSNETFICLDSDEEDAIANSKVPPVPVALTGPNTVDYPPVKKTIILKKVTPGSFTNLGSNMVPIPLAGKKFLYPISSTSGTNSTTSQNSQPVPISLTGPNSQPVPISMTGPNSQAVPISLTGPNSQPVPISLTGPNSQPISISFSVPNSQPVPITSSYAKPTPYSRTRQNSQPVSISYSTSNSQPVSAAITTWNSQPMATTHAGPNSQPVPISLTGPNSQPIPISLTGPNSQPVPFSLTGPNSHPVPISLTGPNSQPVPISFTGPNSQPVPISFTGSNTQPVPISLTGPNLQAVPISLIGPDNKMVQYTFAHITQPITIDFTESDDQPVSMQQTMPITSGPVSQPTLSQARANLQTVVTQTSNQQGKVFVPTSNMRMLHQETSGSTLKPGEIIITGARRSAGEPLTNPTAASPQQVPGTNVLLVPFGNTQKKLTEVHPSQVPINIKPKSLTTPPTPSTASVIYKYVPESGKYECFDKDSSKIKEDKNKVDRNNSEPIILNNLLDKPARDQSDSSSSSRSPSPDPLSLFKNVVHIQAPEKNQNKSQQTTQQHNTKSSLKLDNATPSSKNSKTLTPTKTSSQTQSSAKALKQEKSKSLLKPKADPIPNLFKLKSFVKPKSDLSNLKSSSKTTSLKTNPKLEKSTSNSTKTNPQFEKATSSSLKTNPKLEKSSSSSLKTNSKLDKSTSNLAKPKSSSVKPNPTSSKTKTMADSIDLTALVESITKQNNNPGKSKGKTEKTLKGTITSVAKTIDLTSLAGPSGNQKKADKRPAPPPAATAEKKKKSELMTLKDFDIDDIDDIIELD